MENIVLELPACGHKHEVPCHREAEFLKDPVCSVLVEVEMPVCKHRIQVKCGELQNINKPELCTAVCGCLMACGHECFGTCGRCIERTVKEFYDLEVQHANGSLPPRTEWEARMKHAECPQICNRTMFCGHSCRASCHGGALSILCTMFVEWNSHLLVHEVHVLYCSENPPKTYNVLKGQFQVSLPGADPLSMLHFSSHNRKTMPTMWAPMHSKMQTQSMWTAVLGAL